MRCNKKIRICEAKGLGFAFFLLGLSLVLMSPSRSEALEGWSEIFTLLPSSDSYTSETKLPPPWSSPEDVVVAADKDFVCVVSQKNLLYCMSSDDNGKHWSEPVPASSGIRGPRFPTLFTKDGILHLAWSSPLSVGSDVYYQIHYSQSKDKGLTWSKPIRVSETSTHSLCPQLLPITGGIILIWYNLDEHQLLTKSKLDFGILSRYIENPALNSVSVEKEDVVRCTIMSVRSFDNGKTFGDTPKTIHEVLGSINVFSAFKKTDNGLELYWSEKSGTLFMESKDEGANWAYDWAQRDTIPSRTIIDQVLTQRGEVAQVQTPLDPYKMVPIRVLTGSKRTPVEIAPGVILQSFPRLAFGGEDLHLVWVQRREKEIFAKYIRTDLHPPQAKIVSPTDPSIKTPRFTIEWQGEDDISTRIFYAHSLDKLNWSAWEEISGITNTTLEDGEYDFYLVSKDLSGNLQREPACFHFNTFSVAPDTYFDGEPPRILASRSITLKWAGYDNNPSVDTLLFSYRLDFGNWSDFLPQREVTIHDLTEGSHSLEVRAQDASKNIDETPASCNFTVKLGIVVKFLTTPDPLLSTNTVVYHWTAQDESSDNTKFLFSYQVDGGLWSAYTTSQEAQINNLSEGKHKVSVRAKDEQGNTAPQTLVHEFLVDMTPPKVGVALQKLDSSTQYKPIIELKGEDNLSIGPQVLFQYKYADLDWSSWDPTRLVTLPVPVKPWSKGYKIEVKAKDEAGNESPQPAVLSLFITDRYPTWVLALPIVIPGGIVLIVLFFSIRNRLAARKSKKASAVGKAAEIQDFNPIDSASASTDEEDLF